MADQNMRSAVAAAYDSANWKEKVKKMSNAQIYALYMKFKAAHKI